MHPIGKVRFHWKPIDCWLLIHRCEVFSENIRLPRFQTCLIQNLEIKASPGCSFCCGLGVSHLLVEVPTWMVFLSTWKDGSQVFNESPSPPCHWLMFDPCRSRSWRVPAGAVRHAAWCAAGRYQITGAWGSTIWKPKWGGPFQGGEQGCHRDHTCLWPDGTWSLPFVVELWARDRCFFLSGTRGKLCQSVLKIDAASPGPSVPMKTWAKI